MVDTFDTYHYELAQHARALRHIAEALKRKADHDYDGAKTEVTESLREALNSVIYRSDDEYETVKVGAQRDYQAGLQIAQEMYDADIQRATYVAQAAELSAMAARS